MGYLNKQTVTVDAILTKKGRQLLALGNNAFRITKFAVADDEVDYSLYNTAHPLGTEYYGSAIENMPIVEASVDETQSLRYKLVTLGKNRNTIPYLAINNSPDVTANSVSLQYFTTAQGSNNGVVIEVATLLDSDSGYTATLFDQEAAELIRDGGSATTTATTNNTLLNAATVVTSTVGRFKLIPKDVDTFTTTQLVITGNDTGASIAISVNVTPSQTTN
jgi:hypothetical protein